VLTIVDLTTALPAPNQSEVELTQCKYPENWKCDIEDESYGKDEYEVRCLS